MLINILPIFLIAIAAFFNSIMDTIEHHYSVSVFSNMPKWWSNRWQEKRQIKRFKFFVEPFFDAWHTAKFMFLLTCTAYPMILMVAVYNGYNFSNNPLLVHPLWILPIGMLEWYWSWNLFCNLWSKK